MDNNYLNNPVTKREFKELEFDFQEFMKFIKDNVTTKEETEEQTRKILASDDKLAKKLDTFLTEKTALGGKIDDQDKIIKTIKHRVSDVEVRIGIEPIPA